MDTRIPALARNLLDYSLALKPREKLLIEEETGSEELVRGPEPSSFIASDWCQLISAVWSAESASWPRLASLFRDSVNLRIGCSGGHPRPCVA